MNYAGKAIFANQTRIIKDLSITLEGKVMADIAGICDPKFAEVRDILSAALIRVTMLGCRLR